MWVVISGGEHWMLTFFSDDWSEYLATIHSVERMSESEFGGLAARIRAARENDGEDEAALERVVAATLWTVEQLSLKYEASRVGRLELMQEGAIWLMVAARKYPYPADAPYGQFIRYAQRTVYNGMTEQSVMDQFGLCYSTWRYQFVLKGRELPYIDGTLSLDRVSDGFNTPFSEVVAGPDLVLSSEPEVEQEKKREWVETLLAGLPDFEAQVLRLRYGLDGGGELSFIQVAELLGCSKSKVQCAEQRAMRAMRDLAERVVAA